MRNRKAIQTQVAKLSLRMSHDPENRIKANTARKAHQIFMSMWDTDDLYIEERLCAIFMNAQLEVLGFRELAIGSTHHTHISMSSVAKYALLSNATYVTIAHNHPSTDIIPSNQDKMTTHKIYMALKTFDILLYDHLILGGSKFYWSMRENKDMPYFLT